MFLQLLEKTTWSTFVPIAYAIFPGCTAHLFRTHVILQFRVANVWAYEFVFGLFFLQHFYLFLSIFLIHSSPISPSSHLNVDLKLQLIASSPFSPQCKQSTAHSLKTDNSLLLHFFTEPFINFCHKPSSSVDTNFLLLAIASTTRVSAVAMFFTIRHSIPYQDSHHRYKIQALLSQTLLHHLSLAHSTHLTRRNFNTKSNLLTKNGV